METSSRIQPRPAANRHARARYKIAAGRPTSPAPFSSLFLPLPIPTSRVDIPIIHHLFAFLPIHLFSFSRIGFWWQIQGPFSSGKQKDIFCEQSFGSSCSRESKSAPPNYHYSPVSNAPNVQMHSHHVRTSFSSFLRIKTVPR